jgi:hypothetical protein
VNTQPWLAFYAFTFIAHLPLEGCYFAGFWAGQCKFQEQQSSAKGHRTALFMPQGQTLARLCYHFLLLNLISCQSCLNLESMTHGVKDLKYLYGRWVGLEVAILSPSGHFAMSADGFDYYNWGEGSATGTS